MRTEGAACGRQVELVVHWPHKYAVSVPRDHTNQKLYCSYIMVHTQPYVGAHHGAEGKHVLGTCIHNVPHVHRVHHSHRSSALSLERGKKKKCPFPLCIIFTHYTMVILQSLFTCLLEDYYLPL